MAGPWRRAQRSRADGGGSIVTSSDRYNQQSPDLPIVSVTGNLGALPHPGDDPLKDWQTAGLLRPSLAQTKIATVEATLVGRTLGALSDDDMTRLERGLREALALP